MTPRSTPAIAVASWLLALGALALLVVAEAGGVEDNLFHYQDAAVGLVYPALGWLVLGRLGSHPVGWILLAAGLSGALGAFAEEYVTVGHEVHPGSLPGVAAVAWVGSWTWAFFFALVPPLLLLFPDGKPPTHRWRWVLWLSAVPAMVIPGILAVVTWSAPLEVLAGSGPPDGPPALMALFAASIVWLGLALVIALGGLVVRWRRSRGVSRQQMKVFSFYAVAGVACLVASQFETPLQEILGVAAFLLVPAGMVAAILRHRLYDIDRLVSRTVTYAAIVVISGLVYGVSVTFLTLFLPSDEPFVVATATLAVAALFNPVRRRVQAWVERRFNRFRFDAVQVMEDFTETLQERLDPDQVTTGLVDVVEETMQPTAVGVWVKPGGSHG